MCGELRAAGEASIHISSSSRRQILSCSQSVSHVAQLSHLKKNKALRVSREPSSLEGAPTGKTLLSEMLFLSVSRNLLTNLLHRNARLRQASLQHMH